MEQYKIPKNLQNPEFRFVKLREKIPFEKAWQKNGYKFDDKELLKHLASKQNCGVIGGYGRLRIQDIDDKELADELIKKFDTFTIRTGSGGCHFYFISDLDTNFVLKNDVGEFRGKDYQVVCGNMKHPNGNFYKVERDVSIKQIESKALLEILKPHLRDKELETHFGEKKITTLNCKTGELEQSDESRSAFEFRRVIALLMEGNTREQVFNKMETYSKWASGHDAYKELTYSKAAKYVEQQHITQDEEERLKPLDYKSLINYKVEPVNWLVENIIPKSEVCILPGKRGDGKTWIADDLALGVASGTQAFGENVPEPKNVLIIDEEGGDNQQATRIQLLAKGRGIEKENLNLMSMSYSGLKLDQPNSKKFLEFLEILEEFKPDLIIVDCLQRVVSIDIDKENAQISAMFTSIIRPLIKKYDTGFLFIHHLRKSPTGNQGSSGDPLDEVRGGSEITNYARCVFSVSQPRNQKKQDDGSMMLVLKILKMNNAPMIEPKVLNFQPDNPDQKLSTQIKIEYLGKVEDVLKAEKQAANAIKEYLLQEGIQGEFKTKDITDNAKKIGFERTWLGKGLKELVDTEFLDKVKRGVYIIAEKVKEKPKPTLKPKLPHGSPQKTLKEQKKDLVKTEDDINDEAIEESLRVKKVEALKDNPFCPKCNSPTIKKDNKFVCFDEDCGGVAE